MTSTISSIKTSKKNTFWGLVKWSFFSSVPLFVVYCCILALVLPVIVFSAMADENYFYANDVFDELIPFVVMIFMLFFGIMMSKELHNKRSIDLYASFPVKKVTMFLARYVAGLIMLLIPLLFFTFLAGLVPNMFPDSLSASYEIWEYDNESSYYNIVRPYLPYVMKKCLLMFLSVISAYSMFWVTALLCGTILSTVISYGLVNVLYPLLIFLVVNQFVNTIPGFQYASDDGLNLINKMVITALSPNLMLIMSGKVITSDVQESIFSEGISLASYIIFNIIFTVIMIALGCLIAKKRKNENVQNSFIHRIAKSVVTVFIVTASAIVSGAIFRSMFYQSAREGIVNATVIFILGSIIGAIISFLIFTFLYNKGVRGFFKELPVFGISMGMVMVTILVIITGCFGTDSYIPKTEAIESVAIVNNYASVNLYTQNKYREFYESKDNIPEYLSCETYFDKDNKVHVMNYHITDKEIIEKTRQLHQIIIDNIKAENRPFYILGNMENRYYNQEYYDDGVTKKPVPSYVQATDIQIQYRLKNGKLITRNYDRIYCDNKELEKIENEIISSSIYKQTCFSFIKSDVGHLVSEHITHIFDNVNAKPYGTYIYIEEDLRKMYDTFVKDFMNDKDILGTVRKYENLQEKYRSLDGNGLDEITKSSDDFVLRLTFEQRKRINRNKRYDEENIPTLEHYWYLPESYHNTLKLITQYCGERIFTPGEYLFISKYND